MLMNLLNFEWMLPSREGEEESKGRRKNGGYAKPDSWKKELGLDDLTETDSCSATSFGSQESSVYQWHSPVADKSAPTSRDKKVEPTAEDDLDLPVLSTKRSRKLPGTWYYSSNHIMINTERTKRNVHPLTRKNYLDAAARWHAESMATTDVLFHAKSSELQQKVGKPCRILGVNVFRGENIRAIHNKMMASPADVNNMVDARYIEFGMATARSPRGDLLLVQIFMG